MSGPLSSPTAAPAPVTAALLEVEDLATEIAVPGGVLRAVDGVSLRIDPGETLAVVGESGCGKTMMAMSVAGLLPENGRIARGGVRLLGQDLLALPEDAARAARAAAIGVIFQNPMTALNPRLSLGAQLREALPAELRGRRRTADERCAELLDLVRMPRPWDRLSDFPHELSGGLAQRVVIALALAREARIVIADEPTTALDVSIQSQILDLLDDLRSRLDLGVLLVTHDMGVVEERAHRVLVMYAGQVVERGETATVLREPRHRYTRGLLNSAPRVDHPRSQRLRSIEGTPPDLRHPPAGCRFAPRCAHRTGTCDTVPPAVTTDGDAHLFRCWHPVGTDGDHGGDHGTDAADGTDGTHAKVDLPSPSTTPPAQPAPTAVVPPVRPIVEAVDVSREFVLSRRLLGVGTDRRRSALSHVDLAVRPGEVLGIVGESGCGKSTLGRLVAGLDTPSSGRILFEGRDIRELGGRRREWRRAVQLIFQDPFSSLDPTQTIGDVIGEPLRYRTGRRPDPDTVARLVQEVGLPADVQRKRPSQLSGGQRQRVGIARALALDPRVVVADETVSALDVSVQATILNLLRTLQEERGLTLLFISHDIGVVRFMCDRIAVMYLGKVVEVGPTEQLLARPAHPYTAALLRSVPGAAQGTGAVAKLSGELPSAESPPSGCRFRTRCPLATDRCATEEPALATTVDGREIACHHPLAEAGPTPEVTP